MFYKLAPDVEMRVFTNGIERVVFYNKKTGSRKEFYHKSEIDLLNNFYKYINGIPLENDNITDSPDNLKIVYEKLLKPLVDIGFLVIEEGSDFFGDHS